MKGVRGLPIYGVAIHANPFTDLSAPIGAGSSRSGIILEFCLSLLLFICTLKLSVCSCYRG